MDVMCVPSSYGMIAVFVVVFFISLKFDGRLSFDIFQSIYLRLYPHALNTNNNNNNPLKMMLHLPDKRRWRIFYKKKKYNNILTLSYLDHPLDFRMIL